jgi:hypothetical protein
MPDRDNKDSKAVVIDRVDNAVVAAAKSQILTLALKALVARRTGIRPQALDLVADPPLVGAGEIAQLPQCRG